MDQINKLADEFSGSSNNERNQPFQGQQQSSNSGGGLFGGITNKLNEAAGGGRESEKNEDMLDKGIMHGC